MPTLAHHDRGLAEGPAQFHGLGLRGPEDQKTLLGRMVTRWIGNALAFVDLSKAASAKLLAQEEIRFTVAPLPALRVFADPAVRVPSGDEHP